MIKPKLIPIIYRNINYPSDIKANIYEIAGNFDRESIYSDTPYSLHTEYSYGKRKLNTPIFDNLINIKERTKKNIPQLWFNKEWADDFLLFIKHLIKSNNDRPPKILEIHPPFDDYSSFNKFMEIFTYFHNKFIIDYSDTTILIENRYGSMYPCGKFILLKCADIIEFCKILKNPKYINIKLNIVIDYPQIFSAEVNMNDIKLDKIIKFNEEIKDYIDLIGGFHMWGKTKSDKGKWSAHTGDFNTFFSGDLELKKEFLSSVSSTFNDGIPRFFVPEVNSGEKDLNSIIKDMKKYFDFIE